MHPKADSITQFETFWKADFHTKLYVFLSCLDLESGIRAANDFSLVLITKKTTKNVLGSRM